MFFKMLFTVLVLLSAGVFFVGCFGGVDNPLQEDADEADVADVPEEMLEDEDPLHQEPAPQGPVVRLVSEGLEWREDRAILSCYAEIDSPLDHHLFLYIEKERHGQGDEFFNRPGGVGKGSGIFMCLKGEKPEQAVLGHQHGQGDTCIKN